MGELTSIIIRTKNEERWITQCLNAVFSQDYKDFEVIIVDNESNDSTIKKQVSLIYKKIVTCKDYLPGRALNIGIKEAEGKVHCMSFWTLYSVNNQWLGNLLKNFNESDIVGVYGRQEPLAFTSDPDKRDLSIIFGLDRRVQQKDSFFHNANSMIRKSLWGELPFDETVTNIEDRYGLKKCSKEATN